MIELKEVDPVAAYGAILATITAIFQYRQKIKSKSNLKIGAFYLPAFLGGLDQDKAYICASITNRADVEAHIGQCTIIWVKRASLGSVQHFIWHRLPSFNGFVQKIAGRGVLDFFQERRFSPLPIQPPDALPPGKTWNWTCDLSSLAFATPAGGSYFIMLRDAHRDTPYVYRIK